MTKQLPAKLPKEAVKGASLELVRLLHMGLTLEGLKEEMGHGDFIAALARENIQRKSSERAQNVLNLFRRIKPSNASALKHLSKTKLYTLARWETDEVDAFLEGDCVRGITFVNALVYTTRQMDEVIKQNAE